MRVGCRDEVYQVSVECSECGTMSAGEWVGGGYEVTSGIGMGGLKRDRWDLV